MEPNWQRFKSGSDIRGVAYEGGERPVDLTDEVVSQIADAFYVWLTGRLGKKELRIAVGHDSRLSAPRMKRCVTEALAASGARVDDCGLSSTPAMFMITVAEDEPCDASVQITASHHPFDKNGLKFFLKSGGLESGDISEILTLAARGEKTRRPGGRVTKRDFMPAYAAGLVRFVREKTGRPRPLEGLTIVVDAGNGAGGFYASRVLEPLGADTSGSQFLEPDGRFPNHVPNPENPEAMRSVCEAVRRQGADFGIIFDTDVDRAGAVDSRGNEINRNRLIALIFSVLNAEKRGVTVVTDSVTSLALTEFIERAGGRHRRYKRGYKNVINECIRLNREGVDCPLAIETSGHAALRENYYLDDGAYLMTRLLVELAAARAAGRDVMAAVDDAETGLTMPVEEAEVRLGFTAEDFASYGAGIIASLERDAEKNGFTVLGPSCEGVRLALGQANCVARMSVHDPILPINLEGYAPGAVKRLAQALLAALAPYDRLDTTNLRKFISEEK